MKNHYKLIYYVPDHFNGERMPVGAVVSRNGSVDVVIADRTPGAECLGSDARFMLLRNTLDRLRQLRSFERLPMAIGPHFEMTKPRDLPQLEINSLKWLKETILPRYETETFVAKKRRPSRSTLGKNYLGQFGVAEYMHPFRPGRDLHELNGASALLPSISHGVRGAKSLLLMEPVVLTRHQVENDLRTISTNFFAYRGALQKQLLNTDVNLIAYVVPGGDAARRSDVIGMLSESADRVYDVSAMEQRMALVDRISDIGRSALDQMI